MISGGQHKSIDGLNLGTTKLDRNISILVTKIQALSKEHESLKQMLKDEFLSKEVSLTKKASSSGFEFDQLKIRQASLQTQIEQ